MKRWVLTLLVSWLVLGTALFACGEATLCPELAPNADSGSPAEVSPVEVIPSPSDTLEVEANEAIVDSPQGDQTVPDSGTGDGYARLGLHAALLNTATLDDKGKVDSMISTLAYLRVKAARLVFYDSFFAPITAYATKKLNDNGIDVLITVLPAIEDYPNEDVAHPPADNSDTGFKHYCGYPWMFRYSTVDAGRYKNRIETLLKTIRDTGGTVRAFEIGNETDLLCFNGDIPVDPSSDPSTWMGGTVAGYASVLKQSYLSIKAFQPEALVVTFGAANTYLFLPATPHIHYPNFLLWLKSVNGEDVLSLYSDVLGIHFYPSGTAISDIAAYLGPALANVAQYRNRFWITEFGFSQDSFKSLPDGGLVDSQKAELNRLAAFHNFLAAVHDLNGIVVERAYLYSYDFSLVQPNGFTIIEPTTELPLPSAAIFWQYVH